MRLTGVAALACLAAAGCGGADEVKQKPRGGGELTVTLPPTLPTEPAAQDGAPKAGFEEVAAIEPAAAPAELPKTPAAPKQPQPRPQPAEAPAEVEVALAPAAEPAAPGEAAAITEAGTPAAPPSVAADVPASRPPGASAWATYIRKAGFPCSRIAAADRVERPSGAGLQFYRVQCEGGGTYQATNKRGHLYFRRWRG